MATFKVTQHSLSTCPNQSVELDWKSTRPKHVGHAGRQTPAADRASGDTQVDRSRNDGGYWICKEWAAAKLSTAWVHDMLHRADSSLTLFFSLAHLKSMHPESKQACSSGRVLRMRPKHFGSRMRIGSMKRTSTCWGNTRCVSTAYSGSFVRLLARLLSRSSDPVVMAIACHDIGQYIKYSTDPNSKR